MLKMFLLHGMVAGLMSTVTFAAEGLSGAVATEPAPDAEAEAKSIVPKKYAGKYKDGGSDPLAIFIKEQCNSKPDKDGKGGGEFEYPAFFLLCEKNGVPQEQVDKYRQQVAEAKQGANGRARMTLRNMLAARVRKAGGKVVGIDDETYQVEVAKPPVSGSAAKAQEGELTGAAAAASTGELTGAAADAAEANAEAGETVDEDGTTGTDDE